MKQYYTQSLLLTLGASLLVTLAGCKFGSSNTSSKPGSSSDTQGEAFICFNNKCVLSFEGFRNRLKMLQETQPGIESLLGSMPEADQLRVYSQIAEGCVAEKLVIEYVTEQGLNTTEKFKEYAQQAHEALDTRLYMQAFEEEVRKEVSAVVDKMTNADLRAYYEANREKSQMFQGEHFLKRRGKDEKATSGKKEYAPFEEVIEMVKEAAKQEKLNELVLAKLEDLKKRHGARIEGACLQRLVVKKGGAHAPQAPMELAEESGSEEIVAPAPAATTKAA